MSGRATYPLRLPSWVKAEAEKIAAREGTSLNHFVSLAVAEKVAALNTQDFFATRKGRADWSAFEALMARKPSTETPDAGDELPPGYEPPRAVAGRGRQAS